MKPFSLHFPNCGKNMTLLIASFLFMSCEETIDLDLDQVQQRIVIEGIVSDKPTVSNVNISFTENIYTKSATKRATGAVVTLSDDLGNSETLQEVQPGRYAPTRIAGAVNREYRLKVAFEGIDYTAVSRMPEVMTLDSVRTLVSGGGFFFTNSVTLMYYIADRPGVEEFCIIKAFNQSDGKYYWNLYSDKHSDGRQGVLQGPSFSTSGTSVRVEIISIDKATYGYLRSLEEIVGHGGFEAPDLLQMNDYNPASNITNDALGYFSAQSQRDYVVVLR